MNTKQHARPVPVLFGQVAVLGGARALCPTCGWTAANHVMEDVVWLAQEHTVVTGHPAEVVLTWRPERRTVADGPATYAVTFTEHCEVQASTDEEAVVRADAQLGPSGPRVLHTPSVSRLPF